MSLIVPASYNRVQPIDRGGDVNDVTLSVQDGDATVGWRGDATMDVYREGSIVRVYGFDAKGERYVAASAHVADADWRRTLLTKLRDGDWQAAESFAAQSLKEHTKAKAAKDSAVSDQMAEIADKFVSAVYRDNNSKRFF